ncbi:glycosyltransferase [archaeon]
MRLRSLVGVLVFIAFVLLSAAAFTYFDAYLMFTISSSLFVTQAAIFLMALEDADLKDPKPKRYPSLTIMVPAYNAGSTIVESIKRIKEMEYPRKFKIIVMEDASTDDTYEKIKNIPGIKIIRNTKNQGKAASQNQVLAVVDTELVANIDSDTFPEKDALMKTIGHFNDPKIGAVTVLILPTHTRNWLQKVQQFEYYNAFGFWHKSISSLGGMYVTPGPMTVYRTQALQDVDGFDPGNITEDMEVALHMQKMGWDIKCSVNTKVYTEVPDTLRSYFRQRIRWYRGKFLNGVKYKDLLFNRSHGALGTFIYPMSFIVEILSMTVLIGIITINLDGFIRAVKHFVGVVQQNAFSLELLFNFDPLTWPPYLVFLVLTLLIWGYLLYTSMGFDSNRKPKLTELPYILFYLTFYSFFITFTYVMSFFHELKGSERVW